MGIFLLRDLHPVGSNYACLTVNFIWSYKLQKRGYSKDFDLTSVFYGLSYYFITIFNILFLQTILSIRVTLGNEI